MTGFIGSGGTAQVLIVQLIAFVVVAVLLWKFVVTRLHASLAKRREDIRRAFDDFESRGRDLEQNIRQIQTRLAQIESEATARMKEAAAEGERVRAQLEGETRRRAEAELEHARELMRIQRDQLIVELRKEAARLAVEMAEQALRRAVDVETQDRLVDRYLVELERVQPV